MCHWQTTVENIPRSLWLTNPATKFQAWATSTALPHIPELLILKIELIRSINKVLDPSVNKLSDTYYQGQRRALRAATTPYLGKVARNRASKILLAVELETLIPNSDTILETGLPLQGVVGLLPTINEQRSRITEVEFEVVQSGLLPIESYENPSDEPAEDSEPLHKGRKREGKPDSGGPDSKKLRV
jgi:hypothetical protein